MKQEAQVIKWNCPCGNSYKFHGFTEAPQRPMECKPLTDEQRMEMWRTTKFRGNGGQIDWFIEGTRAAEAAHGITSKDNT